MLLQPDLLVWFGSRGIVSNAAVHNFSMLVELNVLNLYLENDVWLKIVFGIMWIATLTLTIGFRTRVSAGIVFVGVCSIYHRDPLLFNSGDTFIRQVVLWLTFSCAGDALSVDQYLRNKKLNKPWYAEGEPSSPWAQRIIQIQLCLLYLQTSWGKSEGYTWADGTAVYYSSRLVELRRYVVPYIFDHEWTVKFLTYTTLIVEASLATLVWVRPLRYWILAAGVSLPFHDRSKYEHSSVRMADDR